MPHFALLDAARDPKILTLVRQEAAYQCMFGGPLTPEVEDAAPYIVRLDAGSSLPQVLQTYGWTRHWGITCYAKASLKEVRRKLRANLEARLPDGTVTLFRFYDPRVWVPFISASNGETELDPWFDPVETYWAPHPKTGATLKITRDSTAVRLDVV